MRTDVTIQFAFPRDVVLPEFVGDVRSRLQAGLDDINTVEWDAEDPLTGIVIAANRLVHGRRLIRLLRFNTIAGPEDLADGEVFELLPAPHRDSGIKLQGSPISFYRLQDVCANCAKAEWLQERDLVLRQKPKTDIDLTENGEVIVNEEVHRLIDGHALTGVSFRPVLHKTATYYQLLPTVPVHVVPPSPIHEFDHCSACGSPRTRALKQTNGIDLYSPDNTETFEEQTPVLHVSNIPADLSFTDIEFGTLGHRPEGAPPVDHCDFPYRASYPRWMMSNTLAQVLFDNAVSGFHALPAKISR